MAKEPETLVEQPAEPKPDPNQVKAVATGSFFESADFTGRLLQHGDECSFDRDRAVQLRANGLIRYADDKAEKEAAAEDPEPSTDNGTPVITSRSFRRSKT